MRGAWMVGAGALVVSGLVLGCGHDRTGGEGDTAAAREAAAPAEDDAGVAAQPARIPVPEAAATPESGVPAEAASVTVEGKLGCGHCNFHVKDACCLAMQDAGGTVYLLETGERQDELMEVRMDQPAVAVTGRLSEVDGRKVITTDSVELR